MRTLVVGANGQLGTACCRRLLSEGHTVRGSVRDLSRGRHLTGVEVVVGDVVDPGPWHAILDGVDAVVLTANAVAPRAGDDPAAVEAGIEWLVGRIVDAGHARVVLPSVGPADAGAVPLADHRHRVEGRLLAAGGHPVLRLPPFMEAWLALAGSSLPVRGEPQATVCRPSPFLRSYRAATGRSVERLGLMLVPGPVAHRHAFIAVPDVARAVAAALAASEAPGAFVEPREVGGPELLSWTEVADAFSRVLGRRVRAVGAPGALFGTLASALRGRAEVPSRTFALNAFMAGSESDFPPGGGLLDPATMTTVEGFLREKAALPDAVPAVP
jgi:uncharacterized protein YbjT (DUF2867 family)